MALLSRTQFAAVTWLDRRTLLGLLLAALSGIIVLTLTRPPTLTPVLVAGGDINAGTPLGQVALDVRRVSSADGLVAGDTIGDLADWTIRVPLSAGEPLLPSLLVPPAVGSTPDALALSLDRAHAVQGQLVAGDTVDILVTSVTSLDSSAVTETVASGVYILSVDLGDTGFDADRVDVVLAVDAATASLIANARETGTIDLLRVSP
ncbi:MAG: RcpC/CpaB family pilus assembly protein [Acidimicrobiia bacterium]